MNLSYKAFLHEFDECVIDEWHCLFELNHKKLKLKNKNIATRKFQTIIEAVFTLSQRKGFQAMTLRDLCQETGLSMGGLYKYFSNKNDIALIIHRGLIHMAETSFNRATAQTQDPVFELNELLARHVYVSERLKKWFYFVFMECRNLDRKVMKIIMESESYVEKVIYQHIMEANKLKLSRCTNPDFVAAMLKVMLQDWYLKPWKYQKKNINADQYVANLLLSVYQMIQVKQ